MREQGRAGTGMRRFFAGDMTAGCEEARIRGDEFRHMRVLRLKTGDHLVVFNGMGLEREGRILSMRGTEAVVSLGPGSTGRGESPLRITLVSGLTKGEKPDFIVQKATELGVRAIVFYHAERSVPAPSEKRAERRLARLRRIALEAVKQCERSFVPHVYLETDLAEALDSVPDEDKKIFFYEGFGASTGKALAMDGRGAGTPAGVTLLTGPEGGFTGEERALALERGFTPCTLGPRILRAETAAITAVALVQHALGDL